MLTNGQINDTATLPSLSEAWAQALFKYQTTLLPARNLAIRTRREYLTDLKDVIRFLSSHCFLCSPAQVERNHLESYLAELDRRGFSGEGRRRKLASMRSFFGFLTQSGLISHDPTSTLPTPEREYRLPRVLSEAEYKRLQLACAHQVRDAALIEILLQTGIRLSELANLTLNNVELPAKISKEAEHVGSIRVFGKGRRDRVIPLNWKVCRALKSYLVVRPKVDDQHVFVSKFRRGLSPRAIEKVVAKYLEEAQIFNASVHTLRHTFGTHMVRTGAKLSTISSIMGHADLMTTTLYVNTSQKEKAKEVQDNAL